jgi:hypothetical protein
MNLLVTIGHPAHVHFFKNMIWKLERKGHVVKIAAHAKDIALELLDCYGFKYEIVGAYHGNWLTKIINGIKVDANLYKLAKSYQSEILIGVGAFDVAHVCKLLNKSAIIFGDTEHAKVELKLIPFIDVICTPSALKKHWGEKHIRYNGYKELAYLHPRYFKPDATVLDQLGVSKDERFIIMRLVGWTATHDIRSIGFSRGTLPKVVRELERYGNVFITSEQPLPRSLLKYQLRLPPDKFHSVLYYASLYFGEGGTTAVESALLGTPSVHLEGIRMRSGKLIDVTHIHGNFDELQNKYGLLYTYARELEAVAKAIELLEDRHSKRVMRARLNRLLAEKIDVTAWMTEFIERYPTSFYEYKRSSNRNRRIKNRWL